MKFRQREAFTLVEIMAASAIMTMIVLGVLVVTTNILNTWGRSSGQLETMFEANVLAKVVKEDLESIKVRRDGRAWLQVSYPRNVGMLTGENYRDNVPLRPPEIMFYAYTMLRPRYTRDQMAQSIGRKSNEAIPSIPGNLCAIKYQIGLKNPFMESSSNPSDNEAQYNAFYGFYRAVIDPKSTATEAMGQEIQGFSNDPESEEFKYALEQNLWNKTCTIIDEEGMEQQGRELSSWTLSPENLLSTNVVDFRITFGVYYPNPNAGANIDEPKYKIAYIPAGVPFTVGRRIITESAYILGDGGGREPIDVREIENGFLGFAEISMTFISEQGAKEMKAKMASNAMNPEEFKRLSLAYGNTVSRRVIFIAEPGD